ncbi:hypothetical protein VIGAN_05199700 [Vigna angularis var. angularis]|uniref:Secreted protein n=1 Tax=Vigna angularis var. angularis TaxID=157739 RepID=A0A0S3S6P0_PHAAN|nr:hypothetical protein VIGAN_05199700 [Vigna angularis var. angularis]
MQPFTASPGRSPCCLLLLVMHYVVCLCALHSKIINCGLWSLQCVSVCTSFSSYNSQLPCTTLPHLTIHQLKETKHGARPAHFFIIKFCL